MSAESYQLLQDAYGDHALLQDMYEWWFWHFKSGDFDVADKEYGELPKKIWFGIANTVGWRFVNTKTVHKQLRVTQQDVSNHLWEMEKIQKASRWAPHELNNRKMEKRKNTREILLLWCKRKSFCII